LSSLALPRVPGTALYGLAALVALFELGVTWISLHPNVPADYRAYYLAQTTTCLNEPVSGAYSNGAELPTISGYERLVATIRVCGFEGPVGDGLHLVGESGRLRFKMIGPQHNLRLTLQMVAVDFAGPAGQDVDVVVNGDPVGGAHVHTGTPQRFSFAIPNTALEPGGLLDVELKVPEALKVAPQDSNTRKRSIKLSAVRVG
jgi:hypothetical protein